MTTAGSPDPVYDAAAEDTEFCRSLLEPDDLLALKADVAENGLLTIDDVRRVVAQHMVAGRLALDPEVVAALDARIDFSVYVTPDHVYTRGELLASHPFAEMGTAPERVFDQQEVGVFADDQYMTRAVGSSAPFTTARGAISPAHAAAPLRTARSKVFLGGERWEDFLLMKRIMRCIRTYAPALEGAPQVLALGAALGRDADESAPKD